MSSVDGPTKGGHSAGSAKPGGAGQEGIAEEIDIDLNDPAVEDAAVKIQHQFKDYMSKKAATTEKK